MMKRRFISTTLLTKGVSRLSQFEIDADKDWGEKGVSNIKELASGMQRGDIVYRGAGGGTGVLVKLSPGSISLHLTSGGEGNPVGWEHPPGE